MLCMDIFMRPICLYCIFLIAGILICSIFDSYVILTCFSIVLLLFCIFIASKYPNLVSVFIISIIFFTFGAFEYKHIYDINTGRFLDYSGQQVRVIGVIDSLPDIGEAKVNYVIRVNNIILNNKINSSSGSILLTTLSNSPVLDYGRQIEISGKLQIPEGRRNPGGFNYRKYLAQSGVSATIFAKSKDIIVSQKYSQNVMVKTGFLLRDRIVNVIKKSLPSNQAALLNGMLIGYREDLSEEVKKSFSDSGLTHIMAVSGANIIFIMTPLLFLFRKLLKFGQKAANIITIGFLILFIYITGFEPSVLRAVIMAIIILAGQILRREADIFASIFFAAIIILIFNPCMLFNIGFQMSFAATLSLVLFYKNIKKYISFSIFPNFISDLLAATIAAQLGVLPISVFYFNNISLISLITNILVLPVVEIITVLGLIMAVLGQVSLVISQFIGYLISPLLTFILFITKISSSIPYAVIRVTTPSVLSVVMFYILLLFFLWYKPLVNYKIKPRQFIAAVIFLIFIFSVPYLTPRKLEAVFIDVGEGDSIFIKTYSGKTVLIDGGGFNASLNPGKNIGDTTIIPFLLDYGISSLDVVIASHGHDDHIQGLEAVLKEFKVNTLILPDSTQKSEFSRLLNIASGKNIETVTCARGDSILLDRNTYFKVLFPEKNLNIDQSTLNNSSLVLKLIYKDISVLFPGDSEAIVEKKLLEEGTDLNADVLKVAHHGSAYSSTNEFLNAVNPKIAIVSVGKNNFGHPSEATLGRLDNEGAKIYRTDLCGAVILTSNGESIRISKMIN